MFPCHIISLHASRFDCHAQIILLGSPCLKFQPGCFEAMEIFAYRCREKEELCRCFSLCDISPWKKEESARITGILAMHSHMKRSPTAVADASYPGASYHVTFMCACVLGLLKAIWRIERACFPIAILTGAFLLITIQEPRPCAAARRGPGHDGIEQERHRGATK